LDYNEKFDYEIFKDKFTKLILTNNIVKTVEEAKKIFEVKRDDADIAILAKKLLEELRVKLCIVCREDAAEAFETQLVQSNLSSIKQKEFNDCLERLGVVAESFDLKDRELRDWSLKVSQKMFKSMDKFKSDSLSKNDFVEYMTTKVTLQDDTEIYVSKFQLQKEIFEQITLGLDEKRKRFSDRDMFSKGRMSREEIDWILKSQLG
jgi:hypothetical protein